MKNLEKPPEKDLDIKTRIQCRDKHGGIANTGRGRTSKGISYMSWCRKKYEGRQKGFLLS